MNDQQWITLIELETAATITSFSQDEEEMKIEWTTFGKTESTTIPFFDSTNLETLVWVVSVIGRRSMTLMQRMVAGKRIVRYNNHQIGTVTLDKVLKRIAAPLDLHDQRP